VTAFLLGVLVGANVGVFVAALLFAARDNRTPVQPGQPVELSITADVKQLQEELDRAYQVTQRAFERSWPGMEGSGE
jgi:hypothetical protein